MVGWWCDFSSRWRGSTSPEASELSSLVWRRPNPCTPSYYWEDSSWTRYHPQPMIPFALCPVSGKDSEIGTLWAKSPPGRGSAQSHDSGRVSSVRFVSLRFYSLTPAAQHNRVGRAGGPVPLE
ncbi:hypothetical protein CSHISOI_11374 [Colletotrichum shisoi]|uniref:Uncharacterized protein n=1 Tax=Colletotrichum shisoi TaxID=2078593 RepID=A0A5Q4BAT1_9PEZI|nr:hypothetical protein CSHISOI_11374 [Colletotrichum shisoi]